MRIRLFAVTVFLFFGFNSNVDAVTYTKNNHGKILSTLKKDHPRLLFTKQNQIELERLIQNDRLVGGMIAQLKHDAEKIYQFPLKYNPKNSWDLDASTHRVRSLALAYRLTGNKQFSRKARDEMLAAATFKHWYHDIKFLHTSMMTITLSIGYDWLYDELSPEDKTTIITAIIEKGLKPGLAYYRGHGKGAVRSWPEDNYNWNLVNNAGMIIGALAVAEDYPDLARTVLNLAIRSLPNGLSSYAPDGAWVEGPCYWNFGTVHATMAIAALKSALGHDFGLSKARGFETTGFYRMHMVGPTGLNFNYGDCQANSFPRPALLWFAKRFHQPPIAWWYTQRRLRKYFIREKPYKNPWVFDETYRFLQIVWYYPLDQIATTNFKLPLDAHFLGNHIDVVAMRSSWNDNNALYVTLRGGSNGVSHGHQDIGSFVLDADGVRWAMDAGYVGGHKGTKSHNTIFINKDQYHRLVKSRSDIIKFLSTPNRAHAVIDMTRAYWKQARSAVRGIAMLDRSRVLIQDEISGAPQIRWAMLTQAAIQTSGAVATLSQKGRLMRAEILEPVGAVFNTFAPGEKRKKGKLAPETTMLGFYIKNTGSKPVRLVVLLTPINENSNLLPLPEIKPLAKWKGGVSTRFPTLPIPRQSGRFPSASNSKTPKTLYKLQEELNLSLEKYTDRHPRVIRLRKEIAKLKKTR